MSASPWPVVDESPSPVSASYVPFVLSDFCCLALMDDLQRTEWLISTEVIKQYSQAPVMSTVDPVDSPEATPTFVILKSAVNRSALS